MASCSFCGEGIVNSLTDINHKDDSVACDACAQAMAMNCKTCSNNKKLCFSLECPATSSRMKIESSNRAVYVS